MEKKKNKVEGNLRGNDKKVRKGETYRAVKKKNRKARKEDCVNERT